MILRSDRFPGKGWLAAGALALALGGLGSQARAAATIVINDINAPGVGFKDPTPAVPVGGNVGTTVGEQRLIAFTYAANLWGATLSSNVRIVIQAQFSPLSCDASGAVLGSAGATKIFRDFAGAKFSKTWYSYALANKLSGTDIGGDTPQINANFNSELGKPGCLDGTFFYLGLDNNHGASIDFVTVLLHEMGHGLGFQTFTSGDTGLEYHGKPSIWDHFLEDNTTGKEWKDMTPPERRASAIGSNKLVWNGPLVTTALPNVLQQGTAALGISGPNAGPAAGTYQVGTASFGPPLTTTGVSGQLMPVVDQANGTGLACNALDATNALAVNGNIALVDRGTCSFVIKVKNLQNAGAIGVVVADNVAGSPPPGLGGSDATITIPAVRITLDDGNRIKAQLVNRTAISFGVVAQLGLLGTQYAGADPVGRALMYTPNPYQGRSSVSHWDVSAFRNQLMEPAINGDLTHSVIPPEDLTFKLLQDIGW